MDLLRISETKESVFVHINNMLDEINEGNIVSFEVENGPKGLVAVNVKLVK
jgi:cold shock CspA family protein